MKHEEGTKHVGDIGESPRCLLRDSWDDIVEDLQDDYENKMDSPGSFGVDPVGVEVGESCLITGMFDRLGRLLVNDTTGPSPPPRLCLAHFGVRGKPLGSRVELGREGDGPGDQ